MNIVVIGCGRVGSGLAHDLRLRGARVAVVDVDPATFGRLGADVVTVVGSGTDRAVLAAAGAVGADALAAVTGDDDTNAVIARAARTDLRIPRVVARLYDPLKAVMYDRLGVSTVSPVSWGIARIADLVTATDVSPITGLGGGDVEIATVHVPPLLVDRPLAELAVPGEIQPIAHTRAGRTTLADPATTLHAGDLVHLAMVRGSADRLERLLGRHNGRDAR